MNKLDSSLQRLSSECAVVGRWQFIFAGILYVCKFWPSVKVARSEVSLLLCDGYFCRAVNLNFSNRTKSVVERILVD